MNPGATRRTALNEGRGMNPGDTRHPGERLATLNEGRGMNPGDTSGPSPRRSASAPLNEGRGMNPGDTRPSKYTGAPFFSAQRRPGHEPRRHP